ncbi:blastoderm-specific protein 25D isoform X2 [Amyelois transitella]|uniref:blastoderm-specific protein 25D isoform X2 n=1 Tax=Amyelois transitella TaxID=680683 RepID=UPI00298FE4A5|nr:blastoderm-specific protein 25D isoform X2 [Amyelois transitella]
MLFSVCMGSLRMDNSYMNPYEKQLYSVFKTFDVDNEEALNKSAVVELCDALQLEDRGAALVDSLFERRTERVTFTQFRNGLLSVLGAGDSSTFSKDPIASSSTATSTTVSLATASPPLALQSQSDEDSSGREVAPRIVFGSKKYGRRSRPQKSLAISDEPHSPRAASVSRIDTEDKRVRHSQRMRFRRSTSAMDTREKYVENYGSSSDCFDHNRHINYEQALSLCRELHMNSIDPLLIENIFEESHTKDDITVGEFFNRLNSSLSSSIEVARNDTTLANHGDISEIGDDDINGISVESIISCWEIAGVPHPQGLLMELGFKGTCVRLPELENALEEELRACSDPLDEQLHTPTLFLTAARELDRLRLRLAKRHMELTTAERDKLRIDVAEANRRANMLALDNDENHARMEAELAASVRRAEARLAEAARQADAERAVERERDNATRARLEEELMHRAENETRLREEVSAQVSRIAELETRAAAAEVRATSAERAAARLADELSAATTAAALQARGRAAGEDDELARQMAELRAENQQLRDRNDELCWELEARTRINASALPPVGIGDLSVELGELMHCAEECDSSPVSLEPRVLGYAEAARRLRDLLRAGDTSPVWRDKILEISDALMLMEQTNISIEASVQTDEQITISDEGTKSNDDQVTSPDEETASNDLKNEEATSAYGQTEACNGRCSVANELRQKLAQVEATHIVEKQKLSDLVKELEISLEQLKQEYDRCEEYWSGKLDEERELLAEEQRMGDERLAELASKITEYERQFAPNHALPTIQEVGLEAQVTDLEEEFAAYRRSKEQELRERDERIERLAERISELVARGSRACACAALSQRCAALAAAARSAAPLRARAAAAEAGVRRLQARLAAADLLVKDLYVENCQLAHRRPL